MGDARTKTIEEEEERKRDKRGIASIKRATSQSYEI